MEKILTAVPYPVVLLFTDGTDLTWGVVCTDHPTWLGNNLPTDSSRASAEAFAEACACAHADHQDRPEAPQHVLNAAMVAAMLGHQYDPEYADSAWFQWHDMPPVVTRVYPGPTDPQYCPNDVWVVEVQYSRRGGRALYGIDRNNNPTLYQD